MARTDPGQQTVEVEMVLAANLTRVENLLTLHGRLLDDADLGLADPVHQDVLRAAVVLLHASLEELLRSVERVLLPGCKDTLATLKLSDPADPQMATEKLSMRQLLIVRGRSVEELVQDAIDRYLERTSYNDFTEVATKLKAVGVRVQPTDYAADLEALISRRHNIAHKADRQRDPTSMVPVLMPIHSSELVRWRVAVRKFADEVLEKMRRTADV